MIGQEQELDEKRLHDEQLRVTRQLRQELSSRLERIALQEVAALLTQPDRAFASAYDNPHVALVARIVDGRIVLPWEEDSRPEHSRRRMEDADFAHRISQGEHEELVVGNLEGAVHAYRQALEVANSPVQTAYARLLLARTLSRMGHDREALDHTRAALTSPAELVDEHGVPFSLYAAVRLLQVDTDHQDVLACLQRQMEGSRWLSPPALYLTRSLLATLRESGLGAVAGDQEENLQPNRAGPLPSA
jgi:hypothetical protein